MAVATTTAIALGLGLAGSAKQMIDSARMQEQADQAMNNAAANLAVEQEKNKMQDLKVPTLGLDYAQQEIQRQMATATRAAQESGNVATLPGVVAQGREADLQLAAEANRAQYQRDVQEAQNAQSVEARNAQRANALEMARLQGAQNASMQALGLEQAGMSGLVDIAGQAATAYEKSKPIYGTTPLGVMPTANVSPQALSQTFAPTMKTMAPNVSVPLTQVNPVSGYGVTKLPPMVDWTKQQNSPAPWLGM